jgi:hypothetical protein
VYGVSDGGLITAAQPAANAGAILRVIIAIFPLVDQIIKILTL